MFKKILFFILIFVFLLPKSTNANFSETYIYRSTVLGNHVNRTGEYVYEIPNQKTNFSYNEPVYFLTRIFNITNIDSFSFRHVLIGNGINQEYLSPTYYPHRNWWAEIYYWKDLGHLSAGDYDLKIFVKINGGAEREVDLKHFRVGNNYYETYNNNTSTDYYGINYNFNWTHLGKNIRKTDTYKYEIVDPSSNFNQNEDVYILSYLSNLKNINTFQIKYVVYLNGRSYYRTNEVPVLRPYGNTWFYNYSWGNLGKLPFGNHEIRVYLKINGGEYRLLNTKKVSIDNFRNNREHYSHTWSRTDKDIVYLGGYTYNIEHPRDSFFDDENIKVLTKISDISNIDYFKIKHKLYKNNNFLKEVESDFQRPRGNYWAYNFTQADFGRLNAGRYYVKIYISVNGRYYKYLNTIHFKVKQRYTGYNYYYPVYRYNYSVLGGR